jgi:quercetin dioxygenase-like cupin family protein
MSTDARAHFVEGSDVDRALGSSGRVYLAGHLERPQLQFEHIDELPDTTEVGITRYAALTVDQPHLHESNTDFSYVVRGTFAVRMIATGEVRVLGEGGLCVIEPGLAHVCIAHPGTQVLFFKLPGGNDKVPVELDEGSRAWVDEYCASVRRGLVL